MGRGRAKAKQTKVARELKYNPQHTDLDALQRELSRDGGSSPQRAELPDRDGYSLDSDEDELGSDEDEADEPGRRAWN